MDTLHAFKIMHTIKGTKIDRKYDVHGFPLAVQVWAFETIPMLADKWAIRKEWTRIPRMLNWQATDIPTAKDVAAILDDPQLSKKVDEVIEWVRPYHYTDTMAPETASDRVPIDSDGVRDQEMDMEMETRDISEYETGVRTDIETEIEIGQPGIETEGATNGELIVEKDGMTDRVVTETDRQLDVETEELTNRELVEEIDCVTDGVVTKTVDSWMWKLMR
ncbi:Uncharacterized protein Adt_15337 [Abeliophyllum distichum]|uniref:DUF4283 domain-containing protein n=1 Tax=Abeliophyllum distichum TaxID=126358 RepID=A0ABD1U265_9LAMI